MIYINENTEVIKLPKVDSGEAASFIVENQISHEIMNFEVTDLTPEKHYYTFDIFDLDNFVDGQYDYKIMNESGRLLSEGILQYGDFVQNNTVYQENRNTIIYNG